MFDIHITLKQSLKNYQKNYEFHNAFYFELLETAFKLHLNFI